MKPEIITNVFPITNVQWPPKVVKSWCIENPTEHGIIYHAGNLLYFFQVKHSVA